MNGIVVAIDEITCKVRVEFPDLDDGDGNALVSHWLPVGQRKTLGDQDYWLPDEGTQVVCLMDERCEAGTVLCAVYSDADPPPVASKDLFYRRFKDGSIIEYDRAAHKLHADVKGDIAVEASGNCNAEIQGKTVLKSNGTIELDGGSGSVKGVIQGDCLCSFTRGPHPHISATVKASK